MAQLKYKLNGEWVPLNIGGGGSGEQYELPVATQDTLGGVSIGEGIDITPEGKISVKTPASPAESVLYTAQELTEEQKAQARQNIGSFDIFDLPNLIKFDVKSKAIFGDNIVEGQVFALNDFQPIDIDTTDTDTVEAWRTLYHTFSFKNMQTLLGNIDMYKALSFLVDKNMFGENFYSTHIYSNCAWFGRNHKFMKFYSWATSDPKKKILSGFIYDLEKSVGSFKYKTLTNEIEYFSYSYPLEASADTSTNGKVIGQISVRADPTKDMEIATKHYVDNAPIKKASATELGGIKIGTGLTIADDGTLSSNGEERIKYNFSSTATLTDEDKAALLKIKEKPDGNLITIDNNVVIQTVVSSSSISFRTLVYSYGYSLTVYSVVFKIDEIISTKLQMTATLKLITSQDDYINSTNINEYLPIWQVASSWSDPNLYNAKEMILIIDNSERICQQYYNFSFYNNNSDCSLGQDFTYKYFTYWIGSNQYGEWYYNGSQIYFVNTNNDQLNTILYRT